MDRVDAYAALSAELESWRRLSFSDLVAQIDGPPTVRSVGVGGESIDLEVRVRWAGPRREAIRVEAVAYGPSCYRLERIEASLLVRSGPGSA